MNLLQWPSDAPVTGSRELPAAGGWSTSAETKSMHKNQCTLSASICHSLHLVTSYCCIMLEKIALLRSLMKGSFLCIFKHKIYKLHESYCTHTANPRDDARHQAAFRCILWCGRPYNIIGLCSLVDIWEIKWRDKLILMFKNLWMWQINTGYHMKPLLETLTLVKTFPEQVRWAKDHPFAKDENVV